jgi:CBS domain-containing membrane protein
MAEHKLFRILLGQRPRPSFKWMLFSWIGGFLGIFLIEQIGRLADLGDRASLFLIGSFGASAVLVYGAPQATFSQPRNLIGGHCLSAFIGVTIFLLLGDQGILACPLAVALSIFAMQLTGTVHPPGGATALIAVIGGSAIHKLGYWYVLCPVGLGASIMLVVAVVVNKLSCETNRRYPHSLD